ncbi:MAG: hypothetical protein ACKPKO_31260, partial [Candidatus Fonsibacter sp.]
MDLLIAFPAHGDPVDIQEDAQAQLNWPNVVLFVEPDTIHDIIQQICGRFVFTSEFCHNPIGASGDGLAALPTCGKLAHLGGCNYNHFLNEPPSGLVEYISAMGQVEAKSDLLIALCVHGAPVDIK